MVAKCFAQLGVWVGATRKGNQFNPEGYWENDQLTQVSYHSIGINEFGSRFTDPDFEPLRPGPADVLVFRTAFTECARQMGYRGGPILYKDPATVFHWPLWHKAFPDARWLVCERDDRSCVKSLMNFYRAPEGACRAFRERFVRRVEEVLYTPETNCFRLATDLVARGTGRYFEASCGWAGISRRRSIDTLRATIKSNLWHHRERPG